MKGISPEDFPDLFPEDLIDIPQRHDLLAEDYVIHLTALEAGFLAGMILNSKKHMPGLMKLRVRVPGREGSMLMVDRLIEKLEQERNKHKS